MAKSTLITNAQANPEDLFTRDDHSWNKSTAPLTAGLQCPVEELSTRLRLGNQLRSGESSTSARETPALAKDFRNTRHSEDQQYRSLRQTVAPVWPRRLLHVPTMISIQRCEGNWYGADFEPAFNALSYKWGPWVVREGPRLDIHGVSWTIPAVDQNCISINDFQKVFQRMTQDTDYIWIDIACVDQSPEGLQVRMDEIHKEPGIYRKAQKCYIWLHVLEPADLKTNINTISSAFAHTSHVASDVDPAFISHPNAKVIDALASLLGDPWFRTVWTLRETLFCRDAILLDHLGNTLPTNKGIATLETITVSCAGLSGLMHWVQQNNPSRLPSSVGTRFWDLLNPPLLMQLRGLLQDAEAFMLFSTEPRLLWKTTESLLTDGRDLSQTTKQPSLITNHGIYAISCACDESWGGRKCLPCALGVSFKE
jgi:Heterokaryon incompatibility protein (HET)